MKKWLIAMIVVCLLFTIFAAAAFADEEDGEAQAKAKLGQGFRAIRTVCTAFGALGVAASGLQLLVSDTSTASKAKKRILIILMAVLAMYLIPFFLEMGMNLFGEWRPH